MHRTLHLWVPVPNRHQLMTEVPNLRMKNATLSENKPGLYGGHGTYVGAPQEDLLFRAAANSTLLECVVGSRDGKRLRGLMRVTITPMPPPNINDYHVRLQSDGYMRYDSHAGKNPPWALYQNVNRLSRTLQENPELLAALEQVSDGELPSLQMIGQLQDLGLVAVQLNALGRACARRLQGQTHADFALAPRSRQEQAPPAPRPVPAEAPPSRQKPEPAAVAPAVTQKAASAEEVTVPQTVGRRSGAVGKHARPTQQQRLRAKRRGAG